MSRFIGLHTLFVLIPLQACQFLLTCISNLYFVTERRDPSCLIPMDLAFLLDSSSNAGEVGYQAQKDFVKLVSRSLPISLTGSRVGVISYNAEACVDVTFQEYSNANGLQAAIDVLKFKGGGSRIDKALDLALDGLFSVKGGARLGIPKVSVLLTDLETNITEYDTLRKAVAQYKTDGVEVIAVGVGPEVDLQELRVLVGSEEYLLGVESFERLSDLAEKLTLLACKAAGKHTLKNQSSIRSYTTNSINLAIVSLLSVYNPICYS